MSRALASPQYSGLRLDDIAARLRAHPWVQDVRAGRSPVDPDAHLTALRLTVRVLPAAEGVRALRTQGKDCLAREWTQWLAKVGVACPPEVDWRVVEELPAAGCEEATGCGYPRWLPIVSELAVDAEGLSCMLRVPFDMPIFRGHFPSKPIVPGVMQVGWAATLSRDHGLAAGTLAGIPAAKFHRLVRPGMRFVARLERDTRPGQVRFQFGSEPAVVASGRLRFGGGGD